jgi:serine/threonine-protein kinase
VRPEAGKIVAQRYLLERQLASGGMGTLWIAKHLQLDVLVAVKFMSDKLDDEASGRVRFEREAKAAARLTNPHVVRTYDYGIDDGSPFIAMELLKGESLEARLRRNTSLPLKEVSRILHQIAKGLREAQELGIVHRDLKPANVFLAKSGDDEIVKILDFGIAKDTRQIVDDDGTKSGTLVGSPHHMSPEQARGAAVDPRSDLWSLGVLLFRAVTGKRPFEGTNLGDIIAKICGDEIPKASSCARWLSPAADAFFERALRRNPELRFQSAREMADAFDEAISGLAEPRAPAREPSQALREATLASPTAMAIVPRAEATRSLALGPGSAEIEGTGVGTSSDHVGRSLRESGSGRRAMVAGLVAMAALALVVAWFRGGPASAPQSVASASLPAPSAALAAVPTTADDAASGAVVVTEGPSAVGATSSGPVTSTAPSGRPPASKRPTPKAAAPRSTGSPFF